MNNLLIRYLNSADEIDLNKVAFSSYDHIFSHSHVTNSAQYGKCKKSQQTALQASLKEYFKKGDSVIKFFVGYGLMTGRYIAADPTFASDILIPCGYEGSSKEAHQCGEETVLAGMAVLNYLIRLDQYKPAQQIVHYLTASEFSHLSTVLKQLEQCILTLNLPEPVSEKLSQQCQFLTEVMVFILEHTAASQQNGTREFQKLVLQVDHAEQMRTCMFPDHTLLVKYFNKHQQDADCRSALQADAEHTEQMGKQQAQNAGLAHKYYLEANRLYQIIHSQSDVDRTIYELRDAANRLLSSQPIRSYSHLSLTMPSDKTQTDMLYMQVWLLKMMANRTVVDRGILMSNTDLKYQFRHNLVNDQKDVVATSIGKDATNNFIVMDSIYTQYQSALGYYGSLWKAVMPAFDFSVLFQPFHPTEYNIQNCIPGIVTSLSLFFNHNDADSALILLSSNLETWFRVVAGIPHTTKMTTNSCIQYKSLSSLFKSDGLKDYLGNYCWIFNKLLLQEPMNIRNKAAHGLKSADPVTGFYLICCVLKLLADKNIISFTHYLNYHCYADL